jgi:hypothetical protein
MGAERSVEALATSCAFKRGVQQIGDQCCNQASSADHDKYGIRTHFILPFSFSMILTDISQMTGGLDRESGVWRSAPSPPPQLKPLRSITFYSMPEIVELILIKTIVGEQGSRNGD